MVIKSIPPGISILENVLKAFGKIAIHPFIGSIQIVFLPMKQCILEVNVYGHFPFWHYKLINAFRFLVFLYFHGCFPGKDRNAGHFPPFIRRNLDLHLLPRLCRFRKKFCFPALFSPRKLHLVITGKLLNVFRIFRLFLFLRLLHLFFYCSAFQNIFLAGIFFHIRLTGFL